MPTKTYKSLDEAVAEMLQWWWWGTGLEPAAVEGDILRTLFEAVGFEVEDITTRFDRALEEAIPEAVFAAFGFPRLRAAKAATTLRFSRTSPAPYDVVIPAGTRAQTLSGLVYATTQEAMIPQGFNVADAPAEAVFAGRIYNVGAGTITQLVDAVPGVEAVTNPVPATGGQDEETLEEQKRRFALWLASIARGTKAAITAAALSAQAPDRERAQEVLVVDPVDNPAIPPGLAIVYVDGTGATSDDLLTAVAAAVEEVRSAGIRVEVRRVERVSVSVHARLDAPPEAMAPASEAVRAYFGALRVGQKVSYENLIVAIHTSHPSIREVTLLSPSQDVLVGPYQRATLGSLTVEMEV